MKRLERGVVGQLTMSTTNNLERKKQQQKKRAKDFLVFNAKKIGE